MKKVINFVGVILLVTFSCHFSTSASTAPNKPNRIVDTIRVTSNPVILAASKVKKTANWDSGISDSTIQLSQEDAEALMKIAYAEAGNQGIEGQLKICEVVYNRVLSDEWPDSVLEVISQPGQFESYANGSFAKAQPTAETHLALAEFEKNINADRQIIAFETSRNKKSLEKYFSYLYSVKDHDFYVMR